jgi:hypothetical protein
MFSLALPEYLVRDFYFYFILWGNDSLSTGKRGEGN